MIRITLVMALRQIRRNTLRSFLTMLGIVIGVGAVIALVTIGEGATAKVTADISKLGNNLLIVQPGGMRRSSGFQSAGGFTKDDVEAIRRDVPGAEKIAPTAGKQSLAVWGNRNWRTSVTGTTAEYLDVRAYTLADGRSFTEGEISAGQPLCLLGASVKKELFGTDAAVGETIRVDKLSCEVIGVLGAKGQSGMGQDQDDVVLVPLRAAQRRLVGSNDVSSIFITVAADRSTTRVKEQIEELLRERRQVAAGAEDDFNVRDMAEIAETVTSATGALTALLGAIAAVSLLVGGIGIMNIMLVNVTERTREIGIRLAIGAMAREVLLQFLVEAVVLSMIGGVFGIGAGLLGSWAATRALKVPFVVSPDILLVAFLFSAVIGVLFGYLPAHKAARLNPIEALRHE
ncbi:MAG: ABC transporter permease [Myxococcales bacterium]|nr:ABC transporter permease [Sorangiineae bacterium PRO1]MCL4748881.1 ABC transporter permease [Myxococcales bacterium]